MPTAIDVRTTNDHFPGIGRYSYQLVRALAHQRERHELVLLTNRDDGSGRFDLAALASEPAVKIVYTEARPFSLLEQRLVPAELRKIRPAVTHFPYFIMPYRAPAPAVLTIHDIIPLRMPHFFTLRQRILYRITMRLALRAAESLICVSQSTAADLREQFSIDPSRIAVVPEGVGKSFHPCDGHEIERLRALYGLPSEYILYVGSNKPHKNLPVLIEALARLKKCPPLVIGGKEDPRFPEARKRTASLGMNDRVRFLGAVDETDLPGLYSGARAFVFPSVYEGFGLPILEAMACGVPVACSAIPSLCETAGDAAAFFDPGDTASIAATLERVLSEAPLRTQLQSHGLRRAAELTWENAARLTLRVYRNVRRDTNDY